MRYAELQILGVINGRFHTSALIGLSLLFMGLARPVGAFAFDASAAESLAKHSGCFKCHGIEKKKDGPSFRDSAVKYRGEADAETKLIRHVTSGEKVKFDDGHEEEHKKVKTNDPNETKNLVEWIMSLEGGTKH